MTSASAEKLINRLVAEWIPLMGLDRWTIKIFMHHSRREEKDPEQVDTWAYCEADARYSKASLTFNTYKIPDGMHEDTVVHELCHCLMKRMETIVDDTLGRSRFANTALEISEDTVCNFASALLRARGRAAP